MRLVYTFCCKFTFQIVQRWEQEFESAQVLVMTAQVFVDVLNHAFFAVHQLNLLILDECHAAVKDAPMKQVLDIINKHDGQYTYRIIK